jgi:hypothetical protein
MEEGPGRPARASLSNEIVRLIGSFNFFNAMRNPNISEPAKIGRQFRKHGMTVRHCSGIESNLSGAMDILDSHLLRWKITALISSSPTTILRSKVMVGNHLLQVTL